MGLYSDPHVRWPLFYIKTVSGYNSCFAFENVQSLVSFEWGTKGRLRTIWINCTFDKVKSRFYHITWHSLLQKRDGLLKIKFFEDLRQKHNTSFVLYGVVFCWAKAFRWTPLSLWQYCVFRPNQSEFDYFSSRNSKATRTIFWRRNDSYTHEILIVCVKETISCLRLIDWFVVVWLSSFSFGFPFSSRLLCGWFAEAGKNSLVGSLTDLIQYTILIIDFVGFKSFSNAGERDWIFVLFVPLKCMLIIKSLV